MYELFRTGTLLLTFAALGFVASRGHAQESDVQDSRWRPLRTLFSQEQLATDFEFRRSVPYGDRSLKIRLPCRKKWTWVKVQLPAEVDRRRLVPLARVIVPEAPEVVLEMKVTELEREVRLEDWVDAFLDSQKMLAIEGGVESFEGRRIVDAVVRYRVEEKERIGRVSFFKDGHRIYLVVGSAPEELYEKYAKEFALAALQGAPEILTGKLYAEKMNTLKVAGRPAFSLKYPASWQVESMPDVPVGVDANDLFRGDYEKPEGLIRVRIYSRRKLPEMDLEKGIWSLLAEVENAGFDLEGVRRIESMPAESEFFSDGGKMQIYRGDLDGDPVEFHVLVLQSSNSVFGALLVTPARETNRSAWMINRRAWELVGMTLREAR